MAAPNLGFDFEREAQGFRFVIGQPAFRLIWFAQLASQLADKFVMFSLIVLAYRLSGVSTPVAVTLLSYTAPAIVVAPLAGVIADRHDRKLIMVSANFARAALVALIPAATLFPVLSGSFYHLLLITFLFSAAGQLFSPAEAAAIPTVLPKKALLTANSMALMTMVLTLVVGGALAPLVSRLNLYAPYWWAVGLFALAGLLILAAPIPRFGRGSQLVRRRFFHQLGVELKEGIDALGASPVLRLSFAQLTLAVLVLFMMFTLAPAYVSTVLGLNSQDSYLILVPATLGAILSGVVLGQFGRRLRRSQLLVASLVATGLTLLSLASVPLFMREISTLRESTRLFGAAFSFLLGLEFGALMIPSATYLMEHTTDSVRGRIFSLLYMVYNGVTAVPVLLAAALADTVGTNRVVGGLGLLLVGVGLGVSRAARRIFEPVET